MKKKYYLNLNNTLVTLFAANHDILFKQLEKTLKWGQTINFSSISWCLNCILTHLGQETNQHFVVRFLVLGYLTESDLAFIKHFLETFKTTLRNDDSWSFKTFKTLWSSSYNTLIWFSCAERTLSRALFKTFEFWLKERIIQKLQFSSETS